MILSRKNKERTHSKLPFLEVDNIFLHFLSNDFFFFYALSFIQKHAKLFLPKLVQACVHNISISEIKKKNRFICCIFKIQPLFSDNQ